MSPKSVSFLAIALVAILAAPVMSAVADADAGQSSGFYRDQLDANGQGLYDEVGATLAALEEAPVNEAKISYTMSSVPSTEADAVSYAQSVVSDALAALYLSDPSHVWLWDYPIFRPRLRNHRGHVLAGRPGQVRRRPRDRGQRARRDDRRLQGQDRGLRRRRALDRAVGQQCPQGYQGLGRP